MQRAHCVCIRIFPGISHFMLSQNVIFVMVYFHFPWLLTFSRFPWLLQAWKSVIQIPWLFQVFRDRTNPVKRQKLWRKKSVGPNSCQKTLEELNLLLMELNSWTRTHTHSLTASSAHSWPWQWYITTRRTAVWLVHTRFGRAYLCECVCLRWVYLRVRQYSRILELISINTSISNFNVEIFKFPARKGSIQQANKTEQYYLMTVSTLSSPSFCAQLIVVISWSLLSAVKSV